MTIRNRVYNESALERAFEEGGFDALVARSGRNVAYLSGMSFPGTLGRLQDFGHSPRAVLLVWPRDGDPTLLASEVAAGVARAESWIDDVRTYTEYVESPYARAGALLREEGDETARIGVERREMGVENWEAFAGELPDADLVECAPALDGVRAIKTPAELERMKRAVEIQEAAHRETFAAAVPGETERELHARMIEAMVRRGCDGVHGMMQSSEVEFSYGGERAAPVTEGDLLRTDYVGYYDGYAANLSRMAVVGEPSEDQRERYERVREIHYGTMERMLRPGVAAEEVYDHVRERFDEAGLAGMSGLVGHSTGIWWHQEEPILAPGEERELRADMVVCLETILRSLWHIQDQVLITEDGPELLSDGFDTDRLYVIE